MTSKVFSIVLWVATMSLPGCTPESKTTMVPAEKPENRTETNLSPSKPVAGVTTNEPGQPPRTLPLAKPAGSTTAPLVAKPNRMMSQTKQYKMPKGDKSFPSVIAEQKTCGVFLELFQKSEVESKLKEGTFTIFAPNDAAFKKLPSTFVSQLKSNPEALKSFVELHIAKIALTTEMLGKGTGYRAINGLQVNIDRSNGEVRLNGSKIIKGDLGAKKGVVFIVDSVIQ